MSRAARLLDLVQALRRRRGPVSGAALAAEFGVSLRTIYRDVLTLQAQGAPIEGEAGLGYVLKPGFTLPPLMFSRDELEALTLGARLVAQRADTPLAKASADALAKIEAVLPPELREDIEHGALLAGPARASWPDSIDLASLRQALRAERVVELEYRDAKGAPSARRVWPVALAYFEQVRVLVAWCELRRDFRHFRTDRIARATITDARPPRRRRALIKAWREQEIARTRHADGN